MPQAQQRENIEVPMLDLRAEVMPETFDEENRSVVFIASTGARGLRRRYWDEDYYEELEISEKAVRMGRLQNRAPFLNTHRNYDVSNVFGAVTRAWIEDAKLMIEVQFSRREDVEPYFQDVKDRILCHMSLGYNVLEYQITDKQGELDVYRAIDWEPVEGSIVPIAFDDAAVSRSAEKEVCKAKVTYRAAGPETEGGALMPTEKKRDKTPAAAEVTDSVKTGLSDDEVTRIAEESAVKVTEASKAATEAERKRASEIRAAVRIAKLGGDYAMDLIEQGLTIDQARAKILEDWEKQDESQDTLGVRSGVDADVVANIREGASNALLHRANPEVELTDQGRGFANMSLLRMCEDLLDREGVNVRSMASHEIATRALSTSDLAHIAGSLVNRTLLQGYESAPRTFTGVFRQSSSPDFRDINRVRLSGAPMLDEVKEGGEFKYGKLTNEKETYSLATYGKILPFTRQTIVNDDMDALTRVPMMFGRAAADLESDIVWAIVTANANLQDGVALFHEGSHGNQSGSGAAVSATTVGAGRQAMREQTGMEGRLINVQPRFLIAGAESELDVDQFMSAVFAATQGTTIPTTLRTLSPVIEPRLTGKAWYLAADYNQVDTIEYSYLDGAQGVYIETQQGFNVDGIAIKARHDFAAKAIDYRGLYKNAGA